MTHDSRYLSDAAHFPGGFAADISVPRTLDEIRDVVMRSRTVLPVGAQSSLTGGATPFGDVVLSTERLRRIGPLQGEEVTVEAGVPVATLQEALAAHHAWFPPAPTFTGAFAGGIVATNAAGPSTFKYGSVRDWTVGLTVVLADGSVLTLRRGERIADGGILRVPTQDRDVAVPVPRYHMPDVVKHSAGYFARPGMDLVDLFVGSEGTLGVITDVTFKVLAHPPSPAWALVPCPSEPAALAFVRALRDASRATWRAKDDGIDVSAIEHMDRRCLDILGEDGADKRYEVRIPADADLLLLVQLELPAGLTDAAAFDQIANALEERTEGSLARFCRLLQAHGLLDQAEIALPSHAHRIEQFIGIREAVPAGVNQRVGAAQRDLDARIAKTAADMIVPFERFGEMMAIYRDGFRRRSLDFAVWGHISDGNVHPNVIPRSFRDVELGREAILEFGREVARLGGCPLAEHGVGRNGVKQALLRGLYGDAGVEQMRAVKRALDPAWKLAPGVIFTA